jgi:hypothetical protein
MHKSKHLREALRILKTGGIYFSCNLGSDKPIKKEDLYKVLPKPDINTPRKIQVNGKEKEIMLPTIAAWPKSGEQYQKEFEDTGYKVLEVYKKKTRALGPSWIVIAEKR